MNMQLQQNLKFTQKTQPRQSYQFRALFYKNICQYSRSIKINVFQMITPLICLLLIYVIQIANQNNNFDIDKKQFKLPLPFSKHSRNALKSYINFTDCQWYLYNITNNNQFNNSVNKLQEIKALISQLFQNNSQHTLFSFYNNTHNSLQKQSKSFSKHYDIHKIYNYLTIVDGFVQIINLNQNTIQANLLINDHNNANHHSKCGVTKIDLRNDEKDRFSTFLTISEGQLKLLDILNKIYIKYSVNQEFESGIIYMPNVNQNIYIKNIIDLIYRWILPLSLSLLFPYFLNNIVMQKQSQLLQIMNINGIKMINYWFVTYFFNFIITAFTYSIFFIFAYFVLNTNLFRETSLPILFVVLLGWGLTQTAMAIFFQSFINSSKCVGIIGILFSICISFISSNFSMYIYGYPNYSFPQVLQIISFFGFPRIFDILLSQCTINNCIDNWEKMPEQLKKCILFLYVNFAVLFVIGIYFYEILPKNYGISKSIFFPIEPLKSFLFGKIEKTRKDKQYRRYIVNQKQEDTYSKQQRLSVLKINQEFKNYPLICNNLRKTIQKSKNKQILVALKSFNLIIQQHQFFGLVDLSQSGKIALFSLLTQTLLPDYGDAWIYGHSIKSNNQNIKLQIGFNLSQDIFWPQLTIQQHLYFYARLKGIKKQLQYKAVQSCIHQVNLENFEKFKVNQLSGGMKKRLSIAISILGNPKIIFIDEPTARLDHQNRRQIWDLLCKCGKNRTIFMCTNLIQEAQILCSRIGIMSNGILRTVGGLSKLRKIYGTGYQLDLILTRQQKILRQSNIGNTQSESSCQYNNQSVESGLINEVKDQNQIKQRYEKIKQFIQVKFKKYQEIIRLNNYISVRLVDELPLSTILEILQQNKKQLNIQYVNIKKNSLKDLLNSISYFQVQQNTQYIKQIRQQSEQKQQQQQQQQSSILTPKNRLSIMTN